LGDFWPFFWGIFGGFLALFWGFFSGFSRCLVGLPPSIVGAAWRVTYQPRRSLTHRGLGLENDVLLIRNELPFWVGLFPPKSGENPKNHLFSFAILELFGPFSASFPIRGPYYYGISALALAAGPVSTGTVEKSISPQYITGTERATSREEGYTVSAGCRILFRERSELVTYPTLTIRVEGVTGPRGGW